MSLSAAIERRSVFDINDFMRRPPETVLNLPSIEAAARAFQSAEPYPHLIIDNFIAEDVIREIVAHLYDSTDQLKQKFFDSAQAGKAISTGGQIPLVLEMLA